MSIAAIPRASWSDATFKVMQHPANARLRHIELDGPRVKDFLSEISTTSVQHLEYVPYARFIVSDVLAQYFGLEFKNTVRTIVNHRATDGLTPKQHSSGGKQRLLGISKRGNAYLRHQLVNGARSLVRIASGRTGSLWDWINSLMSQRAFNVVTVAIANKLARIVWAIQARGTRWQMV